MDTPPSQTRPSTMPRWIVPAVFTLIVVLFGGMILANVLSPSREERVQSAQQPQGIEPPTAGTPIDPPRELTNFTLLNQDNESTNLSDFQGQPTLIYFGYTFCPDICPTSLADMVQVRQQLGDQADDVHYVFVSVDGERDTPQVMKQYLTNFDESFIGLTGEPATLRRISPDYGLYFQKNEVAGTSADYLVDHSTAMYLIDETGELTMIYGYGTPAEVMVSDLQDML